MYVSVKLFKGSEAGKVNSKIKITFSLYFIVSCTAILATGSKFQFDVLRRTVLNQPSENVKMLSGYTFVAELK